MAAATLLSPDRFWSRGSTASPNALLERDDIARGYKLTGGNVGQDGKKVTLPHYLAMYLYR